MTDSEWLSPRGLLDYYFDQAVDIQEAEKELYLAVVSGEVRARLKGRVLGPEWLKQVAKLKVEEGNPFALPPDIELSVEDAKQKWGRS